MTTDPVSGPTGGQPLSTIGSLHALLDVTRLIRTGESLQLVLDEIARTIAQALSLGAVVINVYRPAWNDFEVASVHGPQEARKALLGSTNAWDTWAPLLNGRFERRGAYHITAGSFDWQAAMPAYVPPSHSPADDDPEAWDPQDALFVPFHDANGEILGIFSVDEPVSGRRPTDAEIDVLVAFAEHAALAVQAAQELAEAKRHRQALEHLLEVSTRLTQASSTRTLLQSVADAIARALEFQRVAILLAEDDGDNLSPAAWSGWSSDDPALTAPYSLSGLAPIFDARFEVEGCYLAPLEAIEGLLPETNHVYRSVMNGTGPRAWRRHSLCVPLSRNGRDVGVIWVEDPEDRLLPGRERLQALRLFADQATTALASADQLATMTFLAEHDPLTQLPNRRAFIACLEELVADGRSFALAFADVDGFKALNDRYGHAEGDAALASLAAILSGSLRDTDRAFRIGGDEFALVLRGADADQVASIVRRISATLAASIDVRLNSLRASFGVAVYPQHAAGADELCRLADEAMYTAKRSGDELAFAA